MKYKVKYLKTMLIVWFVVIFIFYIKFCGLPKLLENLPKITGIFK